MPDGQDLRAKPMFGSLGLSLIVSPYHFPLCPNGGDKQSIFNLGQKSHARVPIYWICRVQHIKMTKVDQESLIRLTSYMD